MAGAHDLMQRQWKGDLVNVPPRLFEPLAVDEQPSNTYELADMLVSGIDIS